MDEPNSTEESFQFDYEMDLNENSTESEEPPVKKKKLEAISTINENNSKIKIEWKGSKDDSPSKTVSRSKEELLNLKESILKDLSNVKTKN
jgi:hypothetical protein